MLPLPIDDSPHLITDHPYINFLRYFKRLNPKFGVRRILQHGRCAWDALTLAERRKFQRDRILAYLRRKEVARRREEAECVYVGCKWLVQRAKERRKKRQCYPNLRIAAACSHLNAKTRRRKRKKQVGVVRCKRKTR